MYAQIISTITNKTLKSVYEQSATFDLTRLLGNSEKIIEYLIENGLVAKRLKNLTNKLINDKQSDYFSSLQDNNQTSSLIKSNDTDEIYCFLTSITQSYSNSVRQNALAITSSSTGNLTSNIYKPHLNRATIPILPMNQSTRDSITNILTSSVASSSVDILYSILIKFDNDLSLDEETVVKKHEESRPIANEDENQEEEAINSNNEKSGRKEEDDQTEDELNNDNQVNLDKELNKCESNETELNDELLIKEELKPTANCHLITIANQNSKIVKLNSLDAHIVLNLMLVLKNQLNTVESLWLPICLPRFNNNAFLHAHFCLLNLKIEEDIKNRFGLIQLTTNKEDFDKCQLAKNIINERLSKLVISPSIFTEINIPILHSFWYQSLRSQTIVWKSKYCQNRLLCKNDYLIHYMAKRMNDSNLKTFWIRSDRHYIALLGWHSPTFQLYIQFDVIATKSNAVNAASSIIKWIKKEEEKILIKDYQ